MDLGCPRGEYPERAHDFQPFAADLSGESRTMTVIYCRLCGVIRPVVVTVETLPLDDRVDAPVTNMVKGV